MPKRPALTYFKHTPDTFLTQMTTVYPDFELSGPIYELLDLIPPADIRIEFDLENSEMEGAGFCGCTLTGIQTYGDLTFLGVTAGGDWECPIYFILYFDACNALRMYIPTDGNIYNFIDNSAYGNNEGSDHKAWAMAYKTKFGEAVGPDFNNDKLFDDVRRRFGLKKL